MNSGLRHPKFVSNFMMKNLGILHQKPLFGPVGKISGQIDFRNQKVFGNMFLDTSVISSGHLEATFQCRNGGAIVTLKETRGIKLAKIKSMVDENGEELSDDEDELCPVDCVREFKTDEEFSKILEIAKEENSLVVVDFYRTSCGSCKYIEQGFVKLCKGAGDKGAPVVFLKHNVIDEYDEQSEVAERLRIKTVPLFHFYKNGILLEAFPTRDKERILAAILKYTTPASQQVKSIS